MEVVSRVTDGYCDRVQVLMEITTGGPTVATEDTSISQLTLESLKLHRNSTQMSLGEMDITPGDKLTSIAIK